MENVPVIEPTEPTEPTEPIGETGPSPDPRQCAAITRKGSQCRNQALPDSDYCRMHTALNSRLQTAHPSDPPPAPLGPPAPMPLAKPDFADLGAPPAALELPPPVRATIQNEISPDQGILDLVRGLRIALHRLPPPRSPQMLTLLHQAGHGAGDLVQPELWGELGELLHYQLRALLDLLEKRLSGNYHTDPYGTDQDVITLMRPLFQFLYRRWWRITTSGLAHVPAHERAMLLANHSGVLPWDATMITAAVYEDHPARRLVRSLYLDWFSHVPIIAPLFTALGQVAALPANAVRLLEEDELICIFPEGAKGIGKPFSHRYRLARFGRCGFVRNALQTGAPIIPVAVVGAEEIYPLIGDLTPVARLIGAPFFPVTPFFPWLGIIGAIPLPTRWHISFLPPIETAQYGAAAADDPLIVLMLCEQVRQTIQHELDQRIAARVSIF